MTKISLIDFSMIVDSFLKYFSKIFLSNICKEIITEGEGSKVYDITRHNSI